MSGPDQAGDEWGMNGPGGSIKCVLSEPTPIDLPLSHPG